jgi:phosphorylcholine metabolism protein LicD
MTQVEQSLRLLNVFFTTNKIDFWLEAGTALAAHRDGEIFSWEHDIDVAIWKESTLNLDDLIVFFENEGFDVVIQKSLPFLDNIIQLKVKDGYKDKLFDIDIYLYTKKDNYAYMRWIQKPEGFFGRLKKEVLLLLRNIVNPQSYKWEKRSILVNRFLAKKIFLNYLKWHIRNSSCIYHRFPIDIFSNLKQIDFYGLKVKIPSETDTFLTYRYGSSWKTPDSQFNETGKWKKSKARVQLPMSLLPIPQFNSKLLKNNRKP